MAIFLVRDFDAATGFREYQPVGGLLPRTRQESYVPWAITQAQQVVYAKTGEHQSWRAGSSNLMRYNSITSQNRRKLCQSEFGMLALRSPRYTSDAVNKVTSSVKNYLVSHFWRNQDNTMQCVYDNIGHYFYTGGRSGFGRISQANKASMTPKQVWLGIIEKLGSGRLDQIMAIHDAIGRKVLPVLGGNELATYNEWGPRLRQDWFDDAAKRGRANRPTRAVATTTGGTVGVGTNVPDVVQSRTRGVDSFMRDEHRTSDPEANNYYDDVDARNLLFGAGISGTTGSLLQAGLAFGKLSIGEERKQYVMAIIGYLVGGGMHSYHESMAVAQKVGVEYNPGGYINSLPQSFLSSYEFKRWNETYYDIVTLGAIHWMYNSGALPSHLNANLTQP